MFPIRVPVHYTHPIWLVVKHQQGIKLGYDKAVKVATLLSDKQMVKKEGKDYAFNPEYHY